MNHFERSDWNTFSVLKTMTNVVDRDVSVVVKDMTQLDAYMTTLFSTASACFKNQTLYCRVYNSIVELFFKMFYFVCSDSQNIDGGGNIDGFNNSRYGGRVDMTAHMDAALKNNASTNMYTNRLSMMHYRLRDRRRNYDDDDFNPTELWFRNSDRICLRCEYVGDVRCAAETILGEYNRMYAHFLIGLYDFFVRSISNSGAGYREDPKLSFWGVADVLQMFGDAAYTAGRDYSDNVDNNVERFVKQNVRTSMAMLQTDIGTMIAENYGLADKSVAILFMHLFAASELSLCDRIFSNNTSVGGVSTVSEISCECRCATQLPYAANVRKNCATTSSGIFFVNNGYGTRVYECKSVFFVCASKKKPTLSLSDYGERRFRDFGCSSLGMREDFTTMLDDFRRTCSNVYVEENGPRTVGRPKASRDEGGLKVLKMVFAVVGLLWLFYRIVTIR